MTLVRRTAFTLSIFCALSVSAQSASVPDRLTGSIRGFVRNAQGQFQMGASVILLNRFDRPLQKAMSDEKGRFQFDSLLPDVYSIKVSQLSFVPASRSGIRLRAGEDSFLSIQLASLFSTVQLLYSTQAPSALMTDDWKWALRAATATRPVLRWLPDLNPSKRNREARLFRDTHGRLHMSAGEMALSPLLGTAADLGTAFAVATTMFGGTQVNVTGNMGYSSSAGAPVSAIRTSFVAPVGTGSHGANSNGPELSVTMRQVAAAAGNMMLSRQQAAPQLTTFSATMIDKLQLSDRVLLDYGVSMDSVQYLNQMNYLSPFMRATIELDRQSRLQASWSSGFPPASLLLRPDQSSDRLQQDMAVLALFPRITRRSGQTRVQRIASMELGYERKFGDYTVSVAGYREGIRNLGLNVRSQSAGLLASDDFVPDLGSASMLFNVGHIQRTGLMASLSQELAPWMTVTLSAGNGGVLGVKGDAQAIDSARSLREQVEARQQSFASLRLHGTVPHSGASYSASYQWANRHSLTPLHAFTTGPRSVDTGLNIMLRQMLPRVPGIKGRLEVQGEMRNLLGEGYLILRDADNRSTTLVHSPRAVRGGLSLIF
jgi:hypothetical protein